jgi:hypothetical protein
MAFNLTPLFMYLNPITFSLTHPNPMAHLLSIFNTVPHVTVTTFTKQTYDGYITTLDH